MTKLGARVDSAGNEITANNGSSILKGERVPGNKIVSFGMGSDQNGNPIDSRAEIVFQQSNGAKFSYTFFAPKDGEENKWTYDKLNKEMLHICNKIVTSDEYYNALPQHENPTFQEFIEAIAANIIPKAEDMKFTLKIVLKENTNSGKWYATFPNFPNFIERDGTSPSTLSTNPKYDFYEIPKTASTEELQNSGTATGDDLF